MNRHLSLPKLLTLLRKMRKHERANMETWLDSFVTPPKCGCRLAWEWLWAQGDWIMPIGVAVEPLASKHCKRHKRDHFDTDVFREDLLDTLRKARGLNDMLVDDLKAIDE